MHTSKVLLSCLLATMTYAASNSSLSDGASASPSSQQYQQQAPLTNQGITVAIIMFFMLIAMMTNVAGVCAALAITTTTFTLLGIISVQQLFSGLTNTGMLSLGVLFIIVQPLSNLPLLQKAAISLLRPPKEPYAFEKARPFLRPLLNVTLVCWITSPFFPNVSHTALLTPIVADACKKQGIHPGLLLMPMTFAIAVANWTPLGSASNLIMTGLMDQYHIRPLGFFELFLSNGIASVLLIAYFVFAPPWFFPTMEEEAAGKIGSSSNNKFCTVLFVPDDCAIAGKTVYQIMHLLPKETRDDVHIISIHRSDDDTDVDPQGDTLIDLGDEITVSGTVKQLRTFRALLHLWWVGVAPDDDQDMDVPASPRAHHHRHRRSTSDMTVTPQGEGNAVLESAQNNTSFDMLESTQLPHASAEVQTSSRSKVCFVQVDSPRKPGSVTIAIPPSSSAEDLSRAPVLNNSFARMDGASVIKASSRMPAVFVTVTLSGSNPMLDTTVHSGKFSSRYHCSIVSVRANGKDLVGRDMLSHTLQTGDTLLLRLAPRHVKSLSTGYDFFLVEAQEGYSLQDTFRRDYIYVPSWLCPCLTTAAIEDDEPPLPTLSRNSSFSRSSTPSSSSAPSTSAPPTKSPGKLAAARKLLEAKLKLARQAEFKVVTADVIETANNTPTPGRTLASTYKASAAPDWFNFHGKWVHVRLPTWHRNLVLLVFFFVMLSAMLGAPLPLASMVGVIALVLMGTFTVKEAISYVDWNVYISGSFSFGIGWAMENSGLARYLGGLLLQLGIDGPALLLLLHLATALVANVVSDRGSIQVMLPVAITMFKALGRDLVPACVIITNASVGGFLTPYGLTPSLIIQGPGRYKPVDFFMFGWPLFVFYATTSTWTTAWYYNFW